MLAPLRTRVCGGAPVDDRSTGHPVHPAAGCGSAAVDKGCPPPGVVRAGGASGRRAAGGRGAFQRKGKAGLWCKRRRATHCLWTRADSRCRGTGPPWCHAPVHAGNCSSPPHAAACGMCVFPGVGCRLHHARENPCTHGHRGVRPRQHTRRCTTERAAYNPRARTPSANSRPSTASFARAQAQARASQRPSLSLCSAQTARGGKETE